MERFSCGTEVISGDGALSALEKWKGKRLLLVTQPFPDGEGMAARILGAADFHETMVFSVEEEIPTVMRGAEGAAALKEFSPDVVVALGDCHVMDSAKLMTFFGKRGCPLATVPTLPCGGGEITGSASVIHERRRYTLTESSLQPAMTLLEPGLLRTCPRSSVAERGFGILVNALESGTAGNAGTLTEVLAREAFCVARAVLPAACTGSAPARQRLRMASVMAGMAWNRSGLGLCHALSGALGGLFRMDTCRLKGVLIPAVIGCNAHGAGKKYAELSRAAGLGGSTEAAAVRNLKEGLVRLRRELGIPETLAQAGLHPGEVWRKAAQIVEYTLADPALGQNPVAVDDFMIRRILEEVTGRI